MPGIPSSRLEDENRTTLFDLSLAQVLGKIKPGVRKMVTALRLYRVKTGKTLRQVARELGIPEVGLCRVERGQGYIPPAWRQKLASFFGVPVSEICDPTTGWPVLVDMEMPKLIRRQA